MAPPSSMRRRRGSAVAKGGKKGTKEDGQPAADPSSSSSSEPIVPKPAIPNGAVGVGVSTGANLRVLAIDLHALGVVLALVAAGYGLWLMRELVTPLLLVAVLTFAGAPIVVWLEKKRVPRGVGAMGFVLSAVLVVAALISM